MVKKRECRVSRYAVITRGKSGITYGFRCATCGVPSKRYSTRELRERQLDRHVSRKLTEV